jgi:hypothetical protein
MRAHGLVWVVAFGLSACGASASDPTASQRPLRHSLACYQDPASDACKNGKEDELTGGDWPPEADEYFDEDQDDDPELDQISDDAFIPFPMGGPGDQEAWNAARRPGAAAEAASGQRRSADVDPIVIYMGTYIYVENPSNQGLNWAARIWHVDGSSRTIGGYLGPWQRSTKAVLGNENYYAGDRIPAAGMTAWVAPPGSGFGLRPRGYRPGIGRPFQPWGGMTPGSAYTPYGQGFYGTGRGGFIPFNY